MVVGLGGKSCSGKNRFARFMEENGAVHVDLDKMNHLLLQERSADLAGLFGVGILNGDETLNRMALSRIVFSDQSELEKLERFIHPVIEEETDRVIRENQGNIILVNGAVLHKSALVNRMSSLIWISSPYGLRLFRAWKRDRRKLGDLIKRFRAQKEFSTQQFPPHVDIYKVYNGILSLPLKRKARKMYTRLATKGEVQ
ncbi:MAG: dephospho-CoA kinase [Spirochaetales bacterium]|nr:dephospho-CoA kinase [Spirochaetales bacterium]